MPPLVSICVPAYNNARFIAATLESILAQTYERIEVIVVDDRSADTTTTIVKGFSDARLRLIENETNLGIGANWNRALAHATGKYAKLMGADDLLYPECIERQVDALEDPANVAAVVAICNTDVINSNGDVVMRRRFRLRTGSAKARYIIRKCIRWGTNLIGEPVAGLFRRDTASGSVRYDVSNPYLIDLIFWSDLLRHGDAFLDSSRLAAFRISPGSVTASLARQQAAYARSFIHQMRRDPLYRVSALDTARGHLLTLPLSILRNFIISTHSRGEG